VSVLSLLSWLLPAALAVLAYAAALRHPGWPAAAVRPLGRPLGAGSALAVALALGALADAYGRAAAMRWLAGALLPALRPAGEWFHAPRFPVDLLAALPLVIVVGAEAWSPGALRPPRVRQAGRGLAKRLWPAARTLLWLAPLFLGWLDVAATSFGTIGRQAYQGLGAAGVPLPGLLGGEPDLRLPALGWWIATCAVTLAARGSRRRPLRDLWGFVPLAAGALGWLARDAAIGLAVPAFCAAGAIALLDALIGERDIAKKLAALRLASWLGRLSGEGPSSPAERRAVNDPASSEQSTLKGAAGWPPTKSRLQSASLTTSRGPEPPALAGTSRNFPWKGLGDTAALAPLATRIGLAAVLAFALSLRWTERMAGSPASDTVGYFEAARDFWPRVALEGTNPIALAYLNIHPASREPLFIVLVSLWFKLAGPALVHQRTLTALASVGGVALTYAFGRATLGRAAGLGAALLLAIEPWHVVVSQEGLREECALLFVYGLALLAARTQVQSAKCKVQSERPGRIPAGVDFEQSQSGRSRSADFGLRTSDFGLGLGSQICAGALAAAAVLTRIDAGAVVLFLLGWWTVRLGSRWRRSAPAWIVFAALVAPLLVGYQLRAGQALTPLGSSMGGDIQASISALLRGRFAPPQVVAYFAAGTAILYRDSIFAGIAGYLDPLAGRIVLYLLLAAYAAGCAALLVRGPRLPAILSVVGAFAPPFVFIAGIGPLGGPGGGYADRYTYLVIPSVLSVTAWACWSALRLVLRLGLRGIRRGIEWGYVSPTTFRPAFRTTLRATFGDIFRGAFRGASRAADRRAHRL